MDLPSPSFLTRELEGASALAAALFPHEVSERLE